MGDAFLARDEEQERFTNVLRQVQRDPGEPDSGFLILVHGPGGIGKSQLLGRYRNIVQVGVRSFGPFRDRFFSVTIDWSDHRDTNQHFASVAGPPLWVVLGIVYTAIVDSVAGNRRARKAVERAFSRFREQAHAISQQHAVGARAESNLPNLVASLTGAMLTAASIGLPVPSPAAEGAARLAGDLTRSVQARQSTRYGRVDSQALASSVQPEEELIRSFGDALREVSRRTRPFVLLLDTGEILGSIFGRLRDVVSRSGARTVWVVGMRLEDPDDADEYSQATLTVQNVDHARLRRIPLAGFDLATVDQYLRNRLGDEIPEGVTSAAIIKMTRGIPLAVRKAVDLLALGAPPEEALREILSDGRVSTVIHEMVRRWFKHVEREEFGDDLKRICALALLSADHDPDLLASMWNIDVASVASARQALSRRHDFVRSRGGGRMHQEERAWIRLHLLHPDRRAQIRAANERAAELLRGRLVRPDLSGIEAQVRDNDWTVATIQLVWHTFWAAPRAGLELLAHLLPAAYLLSPRFAAALLQTATWFAPACTKDQQRVLAWLRLLAPTTPIVSRLRLKFQESAGRERTSSSMLRLGADAIAAAEGYPHPILATDISHTIRVDLLRLQYSQTLSLAESDQFTSLVRIDAALSPHSSVPLAQLVGTRAEEISRALSRSHPPALQDSLRAAEVAVRFNAGRADAWWELGLSNERLGRLEAALDAYVRALAVDPSVAPLHRNRGQLLARLDRFDEALAAYDDAVRIESDNPLGHGNRAVVLGRLGRDDEALAAYDEAIRLSPDDSIWHGNRAIVLGRLGRDDEALAASDEAIRLNPDDPTEHGNRGIVLGRLGRYAEAIDELRTAAGLNPGHSPAHGNLGEVLLLAGRHHEAIAAFRQALLLSDGRYLEASVLLAALIRADDPDGAIQLCESAKDVVDHGYSIFREAELQGIAKLMTGDPAGAMMSLRAVIGRRTPADTFQRELYELLRRPPGLDVDALLAVWRDMGVAA